VDDPKWFSIFCFVSAFKAVAMSYDEAEFQDEFKVELYKDHHIGSSNVDTNGSEYSTSNVNYDQVKPTLAFLFFINSCFLF